MAYYVPAGSLAPALAVALTITGFVRNKPGTPWILASCSFLIAGAGLTFFVVRHINLELFFKPQTNLARARRLLQRWTNLNYVRLTIAGSALITAVLWIRTVARA